MKRHELADEQWEAGSVSGTAGRLCETFYVRRSYTPS